MIAVLFIPEFALQATLRFEGERRRAPAALIPEKSPRARISQINPAARAAGVELGMAPAQAQARCAHLTVKLCSSEAVRCTRAALLDLALACSPWVEDTAEGICTVDLRGAADVRTAEIAGRLRDGARALHLDARAGFAPDPDLAELCAMGALGEDSWREIRHAAELADLPLEMLAPPATMLDVLRRWGVRTIGAFTALGEQALAERLGPEVRTLYARATGTASRPLRYIAPRETFEESIEWEHEVETLEPLLFVLRRFVEQIALRLQAVWLVAAEVTLRLGFSAGSDHVRTLKIPAPTADAEAIFRMLGTHLEGFTAEHPITRMALEAKPARPARRQFGLFESALRDPNQFYETLARLAALLGNERVGMPGLEPTHRPDAVRMLPVNLEAAAGEGKSANRVVPYGLALRRFRPPHPAQVRLAARRPVHVQSATLSGEIVDAHGPMLLSGDWWSPDAWGRCEWDVCLQSGALCRIFEQRTTWFLEGVYD